jgi:hypothetical protein
MTVIVWDGQQLATDRQASDGVVKWESPKAWYAIIDKHVNILTGFGKLKAVLEMRDWYQEGADPNKFPRHDGSSQFIVVNRHGLFRFENSPTPIPHAFRSCAFGTGREFAYGALAMGADAIQAVEAANKYSAHCGLGVEVFKIDGKEIQDEA